MISDAPTGDAARSPIRVFWTDIDEAWPPELERAVAGRLPAFLAHRAERYRRQQDRQARLAARGLLMAALAEAGLPANLDALTWSEQGRPRLPVAGDFNIAHSAGRVLCAWADRGSVGIDVEPLRPVDPADYASVLAVAEQAEVAAASDPSRAFLRIWVAKEAIAKAAGSGLMGDTLPDSSLPPPVSFAGKAWRVRTWEGGGYVTALATNCGEPVQIQWIKLRLQRDGHFRPEPAQLAP